MSQCGVSCCRVSHPGLGSCLTQLDVLGWVWVFLGQPFRHVAGSLQGRCPHVDADIDGQTSPYRNGHCRVGTSRSGQGRCSSGRPRAGLDCSGLYLPVCVRTLSGQMLAEVLVWGKSVLRRTSRDGLRLFPCTHCRQGKDNDRKKNP